MKKTLKVYKIKDGSLLIKVTIYEKSIYNNFLKQMKKIKKVVSYEEVEE